MKLSSLILLIACAGATPISTAAEAELPSRFDRAVVIPLEGIVSPRMEAFLGRQLERAHKMGAELVILQINSPGGYLESSLNMATRMRSLDWARTVAYVTNEALSGAAIIALGCDDIVMYSHARMGDAGPVFQGPDALFRHAPEKIRSDLARRVRDLATAKGRPPALAEAMVDLDLVVYRVVNTETGEATFMSDPELTSSKDPGLWEKGEPVLESREGRFLEVNGDRAVELQLASKTVGSRDELMQQYQLSQPMVVLDQGGIDTAVFVLNLPFVTGLLFVVGLIALFIEFSAPGVSVGGLVAGLCFALFFWSRFLGGTAGWLEVILFLCGMAFIGVELLVLPGFGVAGIAGGLLLLAGIVMASQSNVIPESPREMSQLASSMLVLLGSGVAFLFAGVVLTRYYGTLPLLNRFVLHSPGRTGKVDNHQPAKSLPSSHDGVVSVGDLGVAQTPLHPAGTVRFGNEYVDVLTDGSFVEVQRQVRVIKVAGSRVVVREIDDSA